MKESRSEVMVNAVNVALLFLISVIMIYPYLNQLAISFNDGQDTAMGGLTIFVRQFTLSNYKAIIGDQAVVRAFMVSLARVLTGLCISLLVVTGAAYALSKKDLPCRRKMILMLMIPNYIHAGIIPMYILYRYLGLLNNFLVYILPGAFVFYNFIIMKSFFESLPESMEESAYLDGANEVQIMFSIIIPLSMPVMATVALWVSVSHWNDWNTTLMYITNRKLYTMQYVLMQIIKESELAQKLAQENSMMGVGGNVLPAVTPDSLKSSVFIVATVPIIAVYPFVQKYFVQGIMLGAVKS